MTELSIRERVKAGAELLDEERPLWLGDADADRLDMADPSNCLGAQLYGDLFELLHELFAGDINVAARHGFFHLVPPVGPDMTREEYTASVAAEFEALTAEWRRAINEERRAADGEQVDVVVLG